MQVTDLIPTGISFVSADSTTYNSANYTVVNSSDTVKWKTIVGPILYGDSVVYTWVGKLTNCATGTITNIAYGNVLGITPVPATQDTISCTAGVTSVIPGAGTGNILLYPNPYINEAILKVSSPTNEKITVKIITTTGVEVYSSNDYSTNENISLGSNLPGGLYVLQVITSGQATTLRLVRNR